MYFTKLFGGFYIDHIFSLEKPVKVVNLAAQAGVRYSITNPREYINRILWVS